MATRDKLLLPNSQQSKFDLSLARELLELVDEAHCFFDASERGWRSWQSDLVARPPAGEYGYQPKANWSSRHEFLGHLIDVQIVKSELIGFVARSRTQPKELYVVFRGTLNPPEWLNNVRISQDGTTSDGDVLIHKGFLRTYTSDRNPIKDQVRALLEPFIFETDIKITVTGHSRGGALATVALYFLQLELDLPSDTYHLYSFASPRVGDQDFADKFDYERCFRIANSEDLVPKLPIGLLAALLRQLPLLGNLPKRFTRETYKHVGQPIYFTRQNGSIVDNHIIPAYEDAMN